MEFTTLGRTGIIASRMGLGCGGHSRLGLSHGASEADAERVVREAIDLGVNFIDTAEGYGTEEVVGRAIREMPREKLVISTKAGVNRNDERSTPGVLCERIDGCLKRLQTDYVDVFHLHGVSQEEYPYARDSLAPTLHKMKEAGKIRAVGITEAFAPDPQHHMLSQAVNDDIWEVVMVGFNLVNQSARERVLKTTQAKAIGTLCMFAVRRALSQPQVLRELVNALVREGQIDSADLAQGEPLAFLLEEGVATNIQEAAYRFCRWEPGIDVVLSGTGNVDHLRQNAIALDLPALPDAVGARLRRIFAGIDSVSGN